MNNKTCNNSHPLSFSQGINRNFPTCNGCGQQSLSSTYCCYQCNFDLCPVCFASPFGNSSTVIINNTKPIQPIMGGNKLCLSGHPLSYNTGQQRMFPTCNSCGNQKLQVSYACYPCNYDLCSLCYTGANKNINTNVNFNSNTNFNNNTGYPSFNNNTSYVPNNQFNNNNTYYPNNNSNNNPNTNYNPNYNYNNNTNPIYNPNFIPNQNITQPNYNPYVPQNNQNYIYPNSNSGTNVNYNFNSGGNYNPNSGVSYINNNQIQSIEYKQCPLKHYLTLCDSSTRSYPSCNICGKSNLQYSWTCFNCNYDMCLNCYDKDNTRPTNKVKVCNNRHLLCYTDHYTRKNVQCDKCGKKGIMFQYTCWVCNYDECINCYEGRVPNNCNIF